MVYNMFRICSQYVSNTWTIFRKYLDKMWPIFIQYLDNKLAWKDSMFVRALLNKDVY